MAYEFIKYEKETPIARITLDQPDHLNPLSNLLRDDVEDALKDAEADEDIRVIIIKGAGRAFSAGYDLTPKEEPDFGNTEGSLHVQMDDIRKSSMRWIRAIWDCRKPVIAQVHGYCMAGANDLAGICDVTIAAEDTIFSVNESRVLGMNHLLGLWPLLIGMKKTKELFLAGGYVTGKEAEELGMVNKVVPYEALEAEVEAYAQRVAMAPSELLQSIKFGINRWYEIMGLESMARATAEWDTLGSKNPKIAEWGKIVQAEGVAAALDWRDIPYGDRPFPYKPKGPAE